LTTSKMWRRFRNLGFLYAGGMHLWRANAPSCNFAAAASDGDVGGVSEKKSNFPRLLVGTYTQKLGHVDGKGRGLYGFSVDPENGSLTYESMTLAGDNPTWIAEYGDTVYVVEEACGRSGTLTAYSVTSNQEGRLTLTKQNSVSTLGPGTCHADITSDGKYIAVANYGGGRTKSDGTSASIAVYERLPLGNIGQIVASATHIGPGSGANPGRQEDPHAHMVYFARRSNPLDGHSLFVPELGEDAIKQYHLSKDGKLKNSAPVHHIPGSGPRHMALHPTMNFAYVVDELTSTLRVHQYDDSKGKLGPSMQTVTTLPPGFADHIDDSRSTTAAVKFNSSGKQLYVTNRVVGEDGIITVFQTKTDGRVQASSYHSSGGQTPRDFTLVGDSLLLAANQDSDNIVAFKVNPQDGSLQATGAVTHCPSPVALVVKQMK